MECEKIITRYNGLLPVVEEIPSEESFMERVVHFMEMVRKIGEKENLQMESV